LAQGFGFFKNGAEVTGAVGEGSLGELAVHLCGKDVGGGLAVEAPCVPVRDKDSASENVPKLISEYVALDVIVEVG
jgi:hypothetical protein